MIRRFLCTLTICACLLATSALASSSAIPENPVRLHILAADDSPQAQSLKLELRNVCLRCAEICLADASTADEAYLRLKKHLADFEAACTLRARELGYMGELQFETGCFDFPCRIYGKTQLPAGEYRALRITIGAGEGHNWWCVLYPSLCTLDESALENNRIIAWLRRRIGGV